MKFFKPYNLLFLLLALPLLSIQYAGCVKEYSYEGGDTLAIPPDTTVVSDTTTKPDTVTIPPLIYTFPQCSLCNEADALMLNTWSFKTGNAYVCGELTNPGFFSGQSKTAITLFGPSTCSVDTGMVISVYLPVPLDQDRYNITASSSAFYYYDHNAPNDIFDSADPYPFSVTIQSYIVSTGIVTGSFMGTVLKADGNTTVITDGRFFAKLH